MTPKEKADELIDKMYYIGRYDDKEDYNPAMAWNRAKHCALIAVNEILEDREEIDGMGTNFDPNIGRAEQYYNETYTR